MSKVAARLKDLKIELPQPAKSVANYLPYTRSGNMIYVAGQIPKFGADILHPGTVGHNVSVEQAQEAAKGCAVNIIAQLHHATGGDLDRVTKINKLNVFVACGPEFKDHPIVANGASDLMVAVFGDEVGRHARAAVGVSSLPLGCSVEVDAIVEFSPSANL